ncbi:hypothetical protein GALMADRAFT_258084 [Galerina marginata CBS 339.88]|uniref:AMP-dependent synthetase/ligase domain-containing protein n=1 Tax=Galerina marginata (strain CBS 339.88) TaxID=685588 RepID=A0A067SC16_GALM3|nr:hypothetical protein GALMADRAFT_258084 [Galerina marginata CBS 339.88]
MSRISLLSSLSPLDQELFYTYGIGPPHSVDIPIIHHAFEKQVRERPDAIAVEDHSCNQTLTYRALESHSNRLAHVLRSQGTVPGKRICILARRSLELIIGIVGVLKSGAQYVPIDAQTITDETLRYVLQDCQPNLVLVMSEYAYRVDSAPFIILESLFRPYQTSNVEVLPVQDLSSPEDGAYAIYTSGTTGRPKGIDITHKSATNVLSCGPGKSGLAPRMRVAQLANIAFDMAAWDILGSLYHGCTLCLRGNTSKEWTALLKGVHMFIATPSMLLRHEPEDYPSLTHVVVGGEHCPQSLADKWARYVEFSNCCGPSEVTIFNSIQKHTLGQSISIGKPIPNTNVYILDPDDGMPVSIGEAGCMWVGGMGISKGYLNLPDKTAARWQRDPFVEGGGMMFNTGDLGRWRDDGQLDHLGRVDDQVKVKGFRVELDGVSATMQTLPAVHNAVALLIDSEIWGFVTPESVNLDLLRDTVAQSQPPYAVPKHYYALDDFPLTRNGKVDKRVLRSLVEGKGRN